MKTKHDEDSILLIHELCQHIITQEAQLKNMSLISGHAGIALSLFQAGSVLQNKTYIKESVRFLKKSLRNISSLPDSSFGFGASGVLWVNQYFHNHNALRLLDDLEEIDEYFSEKCCKMSDYDIFHGIIGYGLYFLIRHQACNQSSKIALLAERLLDLSVTTDFGRAWIHNHFSRNRYYNLGLAHGIPSVLTFLSKIYPIIPSKQLETAINETAQFICSFENQNDKTTSFSSYLELDFKKPENSGSRLAWCYGDLGIANALLQAGIAINEERWIKRAQQIIVKTTKRNVDISGVNDVSFCHGVAGLIHLYHKFYQYFGSVEMLSAFEYWLDMLFIMKNKTKDLKGLAFFDGKKMVEQFSVLEGYAGIILALTTLINETNDWDTILLL